MSETLTYRNPDGTTFTKTVRTNDGVSTIVYPDRRIVRSADVNETARLVRELLAEVDE